MKARVLVWFENPACSVLYEVTPSIVLDFARTYAHQPDVVGVDMLASREPGRPPLGVLWTWERDAARAKRVRQGTRIHARGARPRHHGGRP